MSPESILPRPAKDTVLSALAGGAVHLILVSVLWFRFGFTHRLVGNEVLLCYIAFGAFVVGAVPVALTHSRRLKFPLIVVCGLLVASAYRNWATYFAQSPTPTPVGPTAFGWYLLAWVVVLGAALLVGGLEQSVRRRRRKRRAESTNS